MDLNLFENRKTKNNFINKFIEELKNALENTISKIGKKKVMLWINIIEMKEDIFR